MGEVYLAQDSRLDRKVALKILPANVASHQDRMKRFVIEAKAASALNHPNILTIYEIGESDSVNFIATEYIEGTTLRRQLASTNMSLTNVLAIGVQIANALAAAHAAGIIHRDIKPDNIMIRNDGIVKVLDFGLAKLEAPTSSEVDPEAQTKGLFKTEPGSVMGTASYMSPEQARGLAVDPRTDIFSFGVVLYEMVTGTVPFAGSTSSEVLASILSDKEPAPMARFSRDVPAELERIVAKMLRRAPESRYQSMKDLFLDLQSLKQQLEFEEKLGRSSGSKLAGSVDVDVASVSSTSIATSVVRHKVPLAVLLAVLVTAVVVAYLYFPRTSKASINSLAVLPFVNQSGNSDVDYLSDGMTEALINSLSNLPNLSVKARNTVFRYKDSNTDEKKIAQELSVQALVLGRFTQRGDNITLHVALVDADSGNTIWGEQYDRQLGDIALLQKEITRDVSQKLRARLSAADAKHLSRNYTENSEAYQLYLRGRFFWNKRSAESIKKSIEYFEQAIAKDPQFALAYAGLADSYVVPANRLEPLVAMPKARAAALQALAIDETLAEAHTSLGRVLQVYDWNWAEAEKEFKRALELNPRYPVAHQWYGGFLERTGRLNEAISERKIALELDPLSAITIFELGQSLLFAHRSDEAIAQFQKALELDPEFPAAHQYLPLAYTQKGMYQEAIARVQAAPKNAQIDKTGVPGYVYALAGHTAEARKELEKLKELRKTEYISAFQLAYICAALGEKEEAFSWLEKGVEERGFQMQLLKVDPRLGKLRDDPRFQELVKKVGLSVD